MPDNRHPDIRSSTGGNKAIIESREAERAGGSYESGTKVLEIVSQGCAVTCFQIKAPELKLDIKRLHIGHESRKLKKSSNLNQKPDL